MLEEPVDKVPDEETGEFADKEEDHGPARAGFVEAEGYCNHVADEWNPCGKGKPDAVFVDFDFLLFEGFWFYLKPFFNPFPFPDPSYPIGHDTAEPVAEGADEEAADRVACRSQNRQIEGVGAEREDCGGQEGAEKEAEEA